MRVLIIQPWIRQGGAELLSLELSTALEVQGHEAPIAALFVDPHGLPPIVRTRRYHLPPTWLARLFSRSRVATYLLGPWVLLSIVLRAAARADVLDPHNLPAPLVAALASRLRGVPVVWHLNEVPVPLSRAEARALGPIEAAVWLVGSRLARAVAHVPREVLVLDEKTRRSVRAHYGRDATVLRPGLDRAVFAAEDGVAPRRSAGGPQLLCVGKLHPQKNPELAVRTLARLRPRFPDAELVLVGEGKLRPALEATARRLGVADRVRFLERLDLAALRRLYRESDVLLFPAIGHQAWGLTPFEALALGTPAVVSAEAGASEVLGERDAALVVPADEAAFAAAVARLATEPELRERLLANGRAMLEDLTWERYAEGCAQSFARASGS